jgi:hypothetical protein
MASAQSYSQFASSSAHHRQGIVHEGPVHRKTHGEGRVSMEGVKNSECHKEKKDEGELMYNSKNKKEQNLRAGTRAVKFILCDIA